MLSKPVSPKLLNNSLQIYIKYFCRIIFFEPGLCIAVKLHWRRTLVQYIIIQQSALYLILSLLRSFVL